MAAQLTAIDHALFVVICVIGPVVDWLWVWPWVKKAIAAGVAGARLRLYRVILVFEWLFTGAVVAWWAAQHREWTQLMLSGTTPVRMAAGFVAAVAVVALLLAQRRAILAKPKLLEAVRKQLSAADALMPRTSEERGLFTYVSMTAGICEELLYRGFVMWYVTAWVARLGGGVGWAALILALVITSVLFGAAHIYLGRVPAIKAGVAGLVFGIVVLGSGLIWPAAIMHAAVDLNSGDLGFHAVNAAKPEAESPAAGEAEA
jgi:uncharacterized protein